MLADNSNLSADAKPLAMLVFAGEQLWPNIQSVLHWHQLSKKVEVVIIYYTLDEAHGRGAALRLQSFLESYFNGVRIVPHAGSPVSTPQSVRDGIVALMKTDPDHQWILNTTAGLKSMVLGLVELAGQPHLQLIYQEPSGEWFEVARVADSLGVEARKLEGINPLEMDVLPVTSLISSQFSSATEAVDLKFESVDALPLLRLTQEGIAQGWNWAAAFSACGLNAEKPEDILFAQYIGAGLMEMGVHNLAYNLRITGKRDRKEKLGIDLAVNHGGRLLVLDLKLRGGSQHIQDDEDTSIADARRALDLRQRLSGLAAQVVMVRPCRLFSEAERGLARTCNLEVIDQRDAPRIFSRLANLLKIPSRTPEIAGLEAILVEQVTQRGRLLVFGGEDDRLRRQEADSGAPEWVDVPTYLNRLQIERGQNWLLWSTRTEICLRLECPVNPPLELPSLIQTALSNFGRVRVETTPQGYEAIFIRDSALLGKLRQALAGFVNRRLETMVFFQVRSTKPSPPPTVLPASKRPLQATPAPPVLPVGYGTLDDLDAAVDQVFRPPSPPKGK